MRRQTEADQAAEAKKEQVQAKEEDEEEAEDVEEDVVVVVAAVEEEAEKAEMSRRAGYTGGLSAHMDCMVCSVTAGFGWRLESDIAHSDNSCRASR